MFPARQLEGWDLAALQHLCYVNAAMTRELAATCGLTGLGPFSLLVGRR